MARGDGFDGKLQWMGQTALLLMEALRGAKHKFVYSKSAHSGSTANRLSTLPARRLRRGSKLGSSTPSSRTQVAL